MHRQLATNKKSATKVRYEPREIADPIGLKMQSMELQGTVQADAIMADEAPAHPPRMGKH